MNTKKKELLKEIYEKNATRNGLTMSKAELREKLEDAFPKLFKEEKYEPKAFDDMIICMKQVIDTNETMIKMLEKLKK